MENGEKTGQFEVADFEKLFSKRFEALASFWSRFSGGMKHFLSFFCGNFLKFTIPTKNGKQRSLVGIYTF